MKSILKFILSVMLLTLMYSCSNDSEDDITNPPPAEKITYIKHIKPAVDANCLGCHGKPTTNNAPFSLTTYDEVKARAALILTAISKQAGQAGAMPPSGRLPQTTVDAVDQWIKDGLLEN